MPSDFLQNAFDTGLSLTKRKMKISRAGEVTEYDIFVSLSNYNRNLEGPEELTYQGREFVISITNLIGHPLVKPKKGDILSSPEYGDCTITEPEPMHGLGGRVMGYRCRTS